MTGKSYELPDDITGLGGMVTWADEHGEWHTEVFEFLADARYAFREHVRTGDVAYLERLVALDRRQALDPVSYDVMEIDPAPGPDPYIRPIRCPPPTWRGGGTAPFGGGAPSGCIYRCGPPARDWLNE